MQDPMLNLAGQGPPPPGERDAAAFDPAAGAEAFGSVLYYCSLVLFLPLVAFFAAKNLLLEMVLGVERDSVTSNVSAAAVAVVVLHLALGLFIYRAYFQKPPQARIGKQE